MPATTPMANPNSSHASRKIFHPSMLNLLLPEKQKCPPIEIRRSVPQKNCRICTNMKTSDVSEVASRRERSNWIKSKCVATDSLWTTSKLTVLPTICKLTPVIVAVETQTQINYLKTSSSRNPSILLKVTRLSNHRKRCHSNTHSSRFLKTASLSRRLLAHLPMKDKKITKIRQPCPVQRNKWLRRMLRQEIEKESEPSIQLFWQEFRAST